MKYEVDMENILNIENLQINFNTYAGKVQAVRGISFSVKEKEILAIVGESGCGKSVTAKAIMGLLPRTAEVSPDSKILCDGRNILWNSDKKWEEYRGKKCSIVFQDALIYLNPTMKIGRQITEKLLLHTKMNRDEAWEEGIKMLELVGIANADRRMHQYAHQLSGGMLQRVMIAIALLCDPPVLIADEPTTALDVTIQAEILELLGERKEKAGTSIVMITHDLGIVANMADRVMVMYAGKIVESGTAEEIFKTPGHPYTKALLRAVPRLDAKMDEPLENIEGALPNMLTPPKGCAFAGRCKSCMKICLDNPPPDIAMDAKHTVNCWKRYQREK